MEPISEDFSQRLSPKVRMIVNGDDEVNGYRAGMSASVQTQSQVAGDLETVATLAAAAENHPDTDELDAPPSGVRPARRARVSCFVHLDNPSINAHSIQGLGRAQQQGSICVAELGPGDLERLRTQAADVGIAYIETGSPLSHPKPHVATSHGVQPTERVPGLARALHGSRQHGVIVGIIDVGGFDFSHPDFVVDGGTRFLEIWDQAARHDGSSEYGYGRVLTRQAMDQAIADAAAAGVDASDFLPQTIQQLGSHGTHVASIAAGASGVCPHATIVGVTIALSEEDHDRHRTFYDSTRLAQAVDYIFAVADREDLPAVVNISLGTNGHAHDGTSPISRWIDAALGRPGRCVTVAAGNAGQESPQFEGDIGFVTGRIHASGTIPARGLTRDLHWQVVGNGRVDVSENELEIWYRAGDEFAVQVHSPSGEHTDWVFPGEYYENHRLASETFLSIYNERYHPANGANRVSVFLSPRLKGTIVGVEAGTWTVRLRGEEVRDGGFDAWIERDDPRPVGRLGEATAWLFPSYFALDSNVDRSSVSSLACGHGVIAVGNEDTATQRIHASSSQGPTWDGRTKPDIVAPGTAVVAARGFGSHDERGLWTSMTGTSMASPYVAGVAAHMLSIERRLTANQILGMMRRTAQPLPGADYRWQDDAGFGVIQPEKCVARVGQPFTSVDAAKKPGSVS